jgi:hypothetical protein
MPWGKYRGQPLNRVPAGYLAWTLETCDNVQGEFRRALEQELVARLGLEVKQPRPAPFAVRPQPPPNWNDLVRQWHREMVLQFHPDRGGSTAACQALNIGYERLQGLLGEDDDVLDDEEEE